MTTQSSQPRRKAIQGYNSGTPMTEACTVGATKGRCGLLSLSMLLLGSLLVVDPVWAQGEVSFTRQDLGVAASSVTVGDFNGDSQQDLATANFGANTVSILLGQGDGTFQSAQDFGVGRGLGQSPWATSMAMASRIWRRPISLSFSVSILLGLGDGTFQAAQDFAVGWSLGQSPWATSMAMASRIWPPPMSRPTPCPSCWAGVMALSYLPKTLRWERSPQSVTVGDFNGDGRQDLATGEY